MSQGNALRQAVFLDRDGVLNQLVWNSKTNAYESPHHPADLVLRDDIIEPLKRLSESGYTLFIVSNQPSYAKGKTTLENIKTIAARFRSLLREQGVSIEQDFYCYHHPQGIVPEYSFPCSCRKPEPFFLLQAERDHRVDLRKSWMIGDRDGDIECGRRAGCRTILIKNDHSADHQGRSSPDFTAGTLAEAEHYIAACLKQS